jgi:hypothetical protein
MLYFFVNALTSSREFFGCAAGNRAIRSNLLYRFRGTKVFPLLSIARPKSGLCAGFWLRCDPSGVRYVYGGLKAASFYLVLWLFAARRARSYSLKNAP